ncbi:MAG: hypothetical protein LLG00_08070 [Planctomycetaceae bacterium]|nr:hypothetical protein [Planctomycetaceae bacterium]
MVTSKKSVIRGFKAPKKQGVKSPATDDAAVITIDRRRQGTERRVHNAEANEERRVVERRAKVNRRRQIDPTTCERDYTPDEIEFMGAMDSYKHRSGRMFPTCSEVLEVLKSLGYEKLVKTEESTQPTAVVPAPVEMAVPASAMHLV